MNRCLLAFETSVEFGLVTLERPSARRPVRLWERPYRRSAGSALCDDAQALRGGQRSEDTQQASP